MDVGGGEDASGDVTDEDDDAWDGKPEIEYHVSDDDDEGEEEEEEEEA